MQRVLTRHPDWPCDAVDEIAVHVERPGPGLASVRFVLRGDIERLSIPPPADPARTDGLWRHTCFEAFLRGPEGATYAELNLAPSGEWAAYAFDDYRAGMRPADLPVDPAIAWRRTEDGATLTAVFDASGLPQLPVAGPWRVALSAVIEEADGRTSYWALAHPPGKADFHRDEGFALTLPGLSPA